MLVRTLKQKRCSKVYRHAQIVESSGIRIRGNAPRTRILAHLGTVEGLGEAQIDQFPWPTTRQGISVLAVVNIRNGWQYVI